VRSYFNSLSQRPLWTTISPATSFLCRGTTRPLLQTWVQLLYYLTISNKTLMSLSEVFFLWLLFFWQYQGLNSRPVLSQQFEPHTQSFLLCFSDRVLCFCLTRPQTVILLPLPP
jgi:hypothetical protein